MDQQKEFTIDVMVEIPKGSRNKYEYDYKRKMIRYDRMIFSSMHYPSDYGFFLETLGEDGDALDALVLVSEPTFPGCVIEVRPIGVFFMTDEKGPDAKILCVPMSDPIWNKFFSLEEINAHLKNEIEHFFQVYKDLEKKKVGIEGWGNKEEALKLIKQAQDRYENQKESEKKIPASH
ncbi:inorganic pyrophosphatase [Flammeovirgaceae bacterium 311]|nr:inorganic pyrophosphatase [Flammeovirgaceae bacterium 311]